MQSTSFEDYVKKVNRIVKNATGRQLRTVNEYEANVDSRYGAMGDEKSKAYVRHFMKVNSDSINFKDAPLNTILVVVSKKLENVIAGDNSYIDLYAPTTLIKLSDEVIYGINAYRIVKSTGNGFYYNRQFNSILHSNEFFKVQKHLTAGNVKLLKDINV